MDWKLTRSGYYADFVIVPFLLLCAWWLALSLHGPGAWLLLAASTAVAGFGVWTLIEYAMHRWAFHWLYRKDHWIHHLRPGEYIGVPAWQTGALAFIIYAMCTLPPIGVRAGTGLFTGLTLGYLAYIATHGMIHQTTWHRWWPWLADRKAHHDLHHSGKEVNFGVVCTIWDRLFGTYEKPANPT